MILGQLSLICAALFTGASLYIQFVQHDARKVLSGADLLAEWRVSYDRAAPIQAGLAMAGFLLAVVAWWITGVAWFLLGGAVLVLVWPWTVLVVMPVNRSLKAMLAPDDATAIARLIDRWHALHAVRTLLGAASIAVLLAGLNT